MSPQPPPPAEMHSRETKQDPLKRTHSDENGGGAVLDAGALTALAELDSGDGSDIVAEIVGLFLTEAIIRVTEIREGLGEGELDRILQAAHALKSSSASVGAVEFSRCCAGLEQLCRDGVGGDSVAAAGERTVAMYKEVQEALNELLVRR